MLAKLIKYELKATTRTFLPLYIALLVTAAVSGLFSATDFTTVPVIMMLVFGALMVAVVVITFLVLIQRFSKNALGDEGYLTFTLPVTSTQIILSKTLVSLLWLILSGIVAVLAYLILMLCIFYGGYLRTGMAIDFTEISMMFEAFFSESDFILSQIKILDIILFTLSLLFSYIEFIFTVYLCLGIGQLPKFANYKIAVSLISFLIINAVVAFIESIILLGINENLYYSLDFSYFEFSEVLRTELLIGLVITLVMCIIMFTSTKYILDKKLNLE